MKNNLLKKMFFVAIMLTGSVIFAQTVTGTITDANGPLPGASVLVKGTIRIRNCTSNCLRKYDTTREHYCNKKHFFK